MRWWLLAVIFGTGCSGDDVDTGFTTEELCAGEGAKSVLIGTGAGASFTELEEGDQATLNIAPQGGIGVAIRASTTGLQADTPIEVRLDTEIDGAISASFTNPAVQLFCQDDGTGLFTDVVVGLDPVAYATLDDQLPLDGELIDLIVVATDERGEMAEGRVTVEVKVGAR